MNVIKSKGIMDSVEVGRISEYYKCSHVQRRMNTKLHYWPAIKTGHCLELIFRVVRHVPFGFIPGP